MGNRTVLSSSQLYNTTILAFCQGLITKYSIPKYIIYTLAALVGWSYSMNGMDKVTAYDSTDGAYERLEIVVDIIAGEFKDY